MCLAARGSSAAVTIAAANVPGNYAKIIKAIAESKGQVANAKLNEEDKLNVNGEIDFNVPSAEKGTIEKLLAGEGVPYLIDRFKSTSDGHAKVETHELPLDHSVVTFGEDRRN